MKRIILSVAPVNAASTSINADELVSEIVACAHAGASMIHLHVRDEQGKLTDDLRLTQAIVSEVKRRCDIVIQVSTGGLSDLTITQRCAPCSQSWAESHSLNVGSLNLGNMVYLNPLGDVEYCTSEILKHPAALYHR